MIGALLDHAERVFELDKPDPNGTPIRDHLMAALAQGASHPLLENPPPMPAAAAHVWTWFQDLNAGRSGNGFGPNPLSWSEIGEWTRLRGIRPRDWELRALRALDALYLRVFAPKKGEK